MLAHLCLLIICAAASVVQAQEIIDRPLGIQALKHTDYGLRYLRDRQAGDGSWSGSVAVTALALRAFLESYRGYNESDGAFITRPVRYLLANVNDDGSIGEPDSNRTRSTALAMLALRATGNPAHDQVIASARSFLTSRQIGATGAVTPEDPDYGSVNEDGGATPDLQTQQWVVEALSQAGLEPQHRFWERMRRFLSRHQNLRQTNDQSWSGNDGGFVAAPSPSPRSSAAMTHAGSVSLLFAGVDRGDVRLQAARRWIEAHPVLDHDPGTNDRENLFYFYSVCALNMIAWGEAAFVDPAGSSHNWRNELVTAVLGHYQEDGSWQHPGPGESAEGDRLLVTALAINTLNRVIHSLR